MLPSSAWFWYPRSRRKLVYWTRNLHALRSVATTTQQRERRLLWNPGGLDECSTSRGWGHPWQTTNVILFSGMFGLERGLTSHHRRSSKGPLSKLRMATPIPQAPKEYIQVWKSGPMFGDYKHVVWNNRLLSFRRPKGKNTLIPKWLPQWRKIQERLGLYYLPW